MRSYLDYTVEDFVDDLSFIRWAIGTERNAFFEDFYENNPHKRQEMDEAIEIVHYFRGKYSGLDDKEIYKLWKDVKMRKKHGKKRNIFRKRMKWAAALLILVGLGSAVYFHFTSQWHPKDYLREDEVTVGDGEVRLILSDNRVIIVASETVQIEYGAFGEKITINSEEVISFSSERESVHKLVVPYGKRGKIILGDGTEVWVNSGSRLIYPSVFDNKRREVFLSGEAYFNVDENKAKPFRMETSDLDIEVLGTAFNVTAYEEDTSVQTVVEEGRVAVQRKGFFPFGKSVQLNPSQRMVYNKKGGSVKRDEVDVNNYISWKEGYINVKQERLDNIVRQLTRFYNVDISLDRELDSLKFSGKLDLKKDLEAELKLLAAAHPIKYIIKDNKAIIKPEP